MSEEFDSCISTSTLDSYPCAINSFCTLIVCVTMNVCRYRVANCMRMRTVLSLVLYVPHYRYVYASSTMHARDIKQHNGFSETG